MPSAMPIRAGDRFTAHAYNRSRPVFAWKTGSTSIASSTTEQPDPELWLPVEPFATYLVEAGFAFTGGTTGDIKIRFAVPAAAQGRRHTIGPALSTTGASGNARIAVYGWTTSVAYGTGTTTVCAMEEGEISTESTGGILQVEWAQQVANATATVLETASYLRVQRVM